MSFGGQNSQQKANDSNILNLNSKLAEMGDTSTARGNKTYKFFSKSAKPTIDYYKKLLTGDRNVLSETLSPELTNINNVFSSGESKIGEYGPRGGGQVSSVNNLENKKAEALSNVFTSAREKGAEGLKSLIPVFGSTSIGFSGMGMDAINKEAANLFGLNAEQESAQQRNAQAWGGIGKGVGSLAGGIWGGK